MPKGKKKTGASQAANGRTSSGRINKMECMRLALADRGEDAKPKELQDYLWKEFGVDMNAKMISTYKGTVLKKATRKSGVMRSPVVAVVEPVVVAAPAAPAFTRSSGGSLGVEDVRAVKTLADQLGPDNVRDLLDVLYQ
jgi:hypothetical protein